MQIRVLNKKKSNLSYTQIETDIYKNKDEMNNFTDVMKKK